MNSRNLLDILQSKSSAPSDVSNCLSITEGKELDEIVVEAVNKLIASDA
jgi:hypothetical protein